MQLGAFIRANKQRIIERWKEQVVRRVSPELEESELLDHLPGFIDEIAELMEASGERWSSVGSAAEHGRHRMRAGIDIEGLTEEMALVGESLVELAHEAGEIPSHDELRLLMRAIGRGTAASVRAYAAMRDQQLLDQSARHFSFIAHEIRGPLQNARLAAKILEDRAGEASRRESRRLERSLSQLSDLVDNFLVRARLQGKPELELRQLSASGLVDEACADVSAQAEDQGVSLSKEVEGFELEADEKLIGSALRNLLNNAIKFTPKEGHVTVRTGARGDRALFEVEDRCGGMPEEQVSRLFQPFVQSGHDRSGFGLGLMIVKQAAESHQGTVRVHNMPGKGCRFILDLPRHPSEAVSN